MKRFAYFWFLAGCWSLAGCCSIQQKPPPDPPQAKPKWHSIVVTPKTNAPVIHFYNKINPVWWFLNDNEPKPPAAYRPGGKMRTFTWHVRNPLSNFTLYVIGVADKQTVRSGRYPDLIGNPNGGWNFAVTRRKIVYLPFIDYKRGRFEFYLGWRQRGNFGAKLNFCQALSEPSPTPDKVQAESQRAPFPRCGERQFVP